MKHIINATSGVVENCAWGRFELGTFQIESWRLTTELPRHVVTVCMGQLYLTQIACTEALHKRLFSISDASKHRIFQLLLAVTFYHPCST